jgi:hypothetical protein
MYFRWRNMLNRCYWKKSKSFKDYGERGITVCDRWRFGEAGKRPFQCFWDDMGDCPDKMTIDRINNELGYSKENCKWSTKEGQIKNRRNTVFVEIDSHKIPLAEYCQKMNLNLGTIRNKICELKISATEVIQKYANKRK